MNIKNLIFNDLRTCCYLLWEESGDCIIIDPGCYGPLETKRFTQFIERNGLKPLFVLNTHCHFDHILGLEFVCQTYKIPFYAHAGETSNLRLSAAYSSYFGLKLPEPTVTLQPVSDQQTLYLGQTPIEIHATPGHSQGSICLYLPTRGIAFTGDTLFAGSIGRTDLPGGDFSLLQHSLQKIVATLSPETIIYPGHGPSSTLQEERLHNPYLQDF